MPDFLQSEAESLNAILAQTRRINGHLTNAWSGADLAVSGWDDFLRSCPQGQFQQSGAWAETKEKEGWKNHRVIFEHAGQIDGGFQLLWRSTRFGRIGYISKGPVLSSEGAEENSFAVDLLFTVLSSLQLSAMIVQPPDNSQSLSSALAANSFAADQLMDVITASCMVDLRGCPGTWETNFARSRKVEIRQARRRGLSIREGGPSDIPKFFKLMSSTCMRQGVQPNPGSAEKLGDLVKAFRSRGEARLSFADFQGESIACALDLRFGQRVTVWKKGWNGSNPHLHPNALLADQSMRWAYDLGCDYYDFAGMDRELAEAVLAERPLTEKQKADRDFFNLQFGAKPRLLPLALIYWRNPLVRFIYSKVAAWSWAAAGAGRIAKRLGSN